MSLWLRPTESASANKPMMLWKSGELERIPHSPSWKEGAQLQGQASLQTLTLLLTSCVARAGRLAPLSLSFHICEMGVASFNPRGLLRREV